MNWGAKHAISIAGGKGGTGKSVFAANLGVGLSMAGRRVVLMDTDAGAANLHTLLGIDRPSKDLAGFLDDSRLTFDQVLADTPYSGLRLLGCGGLLSEVSPSRHMQQRLARAVQTVDADIFIIDISAGSDRRAIDYFTLAPVGVLVVDALPTTLENAFQFITSLVYRSLLRHFYRDAEATYMIQMVLDPRSGGQGMPFSQVLCRLAERDSRKVEEFRAYFEGGAYRMCLLVNSVKTSAQHKAVGTFIKVVKRYFEIDVAVVGELPYEPLMDEAISQRIPFTAKYPASGYARGLRSAIAKLAL